MSNRYVPFYSLAEASHYGNMSVVVKKYVVLFIDDNESFFMTFIVLRSYN